MFSMNKKITPTWFLVIILLGIVLLAGCSRSTTPESKPPAVMQIGIIDMDKAIKAHPKYQEWQKLNQQAATLQQQLTMGAEQAAAQPSEPPPGIDMQGSAAAGLQTAAEQEFNAKMAAKYRELQTVLTQKAGKKQEELSVRFKAYVQELDEEYQPRIFSYQLKLQALRLDEKQVAGLQQALDALKAEYADKLTAKEKELSQELDKLMEPEKAAMEQELAAYANSLNAELNSQTAAKTANISAQIAQAMPMPAPTAINAQLEQQLGMKQQEIKVLEEYMVNDIRDKAGKVAVERGLETVLTGYQVNVNAVDITNAVIAAFKK